jgi:hypothetical protein
MVANNSMLSHCGMPASNTRDLSFVYLSIDFMRILYDPRVCVLVQVIRVNSRIGYPCMTMPGNWGIRNFFSSGLSVLFHAAILNLF